MISWHKLQPVLSVDLHVTGRVVTAGGDSAVRVWRTFNEEGKIKVEFLSNLDLHTKTVNVVRFSPDGQLLASASDDGMIHIWKLSDEPPQKKAPAFGQDEEDVLVNKETWVKENTLRGHTDDIYDICWSPDSKSLVSGSVDNRVLLWDIEKGKPIQSLEDHSHYVQGVAWDPLSKYIATQSCDRTCRLYSTNRVKAQVQFKLTQTHCKRQGGKEKDKDKDKDKEEEKLAESVLLAKENIDSNKTEPNAQESQTAPIHVQKQHQMFADETIPSFFRRLTFSPDGAFLLVPTGLYKELQADLPDDRPAVNTKAKSINTVYMFARGDLSRPVAHLPCDTPSVAIKFNPIFYQLRYTGTGLASTLSYRMVFAVATTEMVLLYDTEQMHPFAMLKGLHYTPLTDVSWSADGRRLCIASSDGYCSFVDFSEQELGTPLSEEALKAAQDKIAAQKAQIKADLEPKKKAPKKSAGASKSSGPSIPSVQEPSATPDVANSPAQSSPGVSTAAGAVATHLVPEPAVAKLPKKSARTLSSFWQKPTSKTSESSTPRNTSQGPSVADTSPTVNILQPRSKTQNVPLGTTSEAVNILQPRSKNSSTSTASTVNTSEVVHVLQPRSKSMQAVTTEPQATINILQPRSKRTITPTLVEGATTTETCTPSTPAQDSNSTPNPCRCFQASCTCSPKSPISSTPNQSSSVSTSPPKATTNSTNSPAAEPINILQPRSKSKSKRQLMPEESSTDASASAGSASEPPTKKLALDNAAI